ncbi:MAG: hypothetical protein J6S58_08135 [Lentisphaeria bacterium]|nr:hypothetical protein [Lentisphaeria bacterium]
MNLIYQGESYERSEKGSIRKKIYCGTREELESCLDSIEVGKQESGSEEYISSAILTQKDGPLWGLEITSVDPLTEGEYFNRKPNTAYGEKSARLECSCSTIPVESLPSYRKHWDHYLIVGEKADSSGTVLAADVLNSQPDFWETASASFIMPREFANTYRWIKDPAECPVYVGSDSRKWRICRTPTKPGVAYVDKAVYRITESIRCRTSRSAGEFAANVINKITVPFERFGIKHNPNCWKCDSASIHWNGKDWIATIVYTMSPDPAGWDKDLYGEDL